MRKLFKSGNYLARLAIIVLIMAVAVAMMAGFAGMAGASESPKAKQPMLKLEMADGIKLAQDCGISAFYASLVQAFQKDTSGASGVVHSGGSDGSSGASSGDISSGSTSDGAGGGASGESAGGSSTQIPERISKAFKQQIQTLASMNNTAVDRGSAILDKQLAAIRAELEANARYQLDSYEQYLIEEDEYERQTYVAEQKLARERFHRILEAQYAPVLLNLQMQLYSISLTERPEINTQVNMINNEIKGLVAEREEQDRLELEVFVSRQAVKRRELINEKQLSLTGWVEEEYARLSSLLQSNLLNENSAKAQAIEDGIYRRLEELGE